MLCPPPSTLSSHITHVISRKTFYQTPSLTLQPHTTLATFRRRSGLPRDPEDILDFLTLSSNTTCESARWNPARPTILTSQRHTRPRSIGAQPTKTSDITQSKRLAWWVRIVPPYMLCSSTIKFFLSEKTVGEFPPVDFITKKEKLYTVHTYIGG